MSSAAIPLEGRRVLITGAARGIGAGTARRLHQRGARVALAGLEPELLAQVAAECGDAPWFHCDVTDRAQVEDAVDGAVERLGGLDVVIANAGVASPAAADRRATPRSSSASSPSTCSASTTPCAPPGPTSRTRAGTRWRSPPSPPPLHAPMLGPYSASKAAVEALGDTLRIELRSSGARVGVGYFGFIDTDMVSRGLQTKAAEQAPRGRRRAAIKPAPL